jgi:phosphotransferase family enzyme
VKWLRDHPDGLRTDPAQQLTEYVALQFLADLGLHLAPRILAADLPTSVLVLEDLAPRAPLAALLASQPPEPAAAAGLVQFAAATGRLHAATAGKDERYYQRRRQHGPVDPLIERQRFFTPWPDVLALADSLGVALTIGVEADVASSIQELTEPGPFRAFSNGDAGTNNFLSADGADGKLIDFEFAGFRHALCDIACLYVPGPMWITVADPSTDATEDAYRAAVSDAIPEATDDRRYGRGVTSAALIYALFRLGRLALLDGRRPGDGSRLQMVSTLETAAAVAARFGVHLHLAGWARRAADRLRRRWPDTDIDLTTVPSYTLRH